MVHNTNNSIIPLNRSCESSLCLHVVANITCVQWTWIISSGTIFIRYKAIVLFVDDGVQNKAHACEYHPQLFFVCQELCHPALTLPFTDISVKMSTNAKNFNWNGKLEGTSPGTVLGTSADNIWKYWLTTTISSHDWICTAGNYSPSCASLSWYLLPVAAHLSSRHVHNKRKT